MNTAVYDFIPTLTLSGNGSVFSVPDQGTHTNQSVSFDISKGGGTSGKIEFKYGGVPVFSWGGVASTYAGLLSINNPVGELILGTQGINRVGIDGAGTVFPVVDNGYDLGTVGNRWRQVYSGGITTGTLAASSTVSGTGFSTYLASPPPIGSTSRNTGEFSTVAITTPLPIASGGTGNSTGTATTNANLTGPITSVGNATSIASQTGTGTKFVVDTSPTLITPVIGVATGTSLSVSGALTTTGGTITPYYPNGIVGVATGSAVTAGSIGEKITATGTGVTIPNTTPTAVASVSLTAGNWLVTGACTFNYTGGGTTSLLATWVGLSTSIPGSNTDYSITQAALAAETSQAPPTQVINIGSTQTCYVCMYAGVVGTITGNARITAVRIS